MITQKTRAVKPAITTTRQPDATLRTRTGYAMSAYRHDTPTIAYAINADGTLSYAPPTCAGCRHYTDRPNPVWLRNDGQPRHLCPNCKRALDTLPQWALGALFCNILAGEVGYK